MSMIEMIKKSLLASLGAAVVTRDEVQKVTKRLVDEGKITKDEAEKLAQDLMESGKHQWEEIQEEIAESVRKGMDNLDIGSKKDFQELKAHVENLEKRLTILEETAKE